MFGLIISLLIVFMYALVYAAVTFGIIFIVSKTITLKWSEKMMSAKRLTFILLTTFFGIAFLIYHSSYWRNSGFGDSFIIPIGNGYQVNNIDGASTYFEESKSGKGRQAFLLKFTVADDKLCAGFQGFNNMDCNDCYLVFDTNLEKMYEFHSSEAYTQFATENKLPLAESFKEFSDNYNSYWAKNTRWYLP